jgi:hypothetical protein
VLQAKSSLQRLQIQRHVHGVGDSLSWVRKGANAVGSLSIGSGLLGLAMRRVTGSPVGQAVALTSGLLLLSRVVGLGWRLLRSEPPRSSARGAP